MLFGEWSQSVTQALEKEFFVVSDQNVVDHIATFAHICLKQK
jgi:hypothetical protein